MKNVVCLIKLVEREDLPGAGEVCLVPEAERVVTIHYTADQEELFESRVAAEVAELDALLALCEEVKAVLNRQRLAGAEDAVRFMEEIFTGKIADGGFDIDEGVEGFFREREVFGVSGEEFEAGGVVVEFAQVNGLIG